MCPGCRLEHAPNADLMAAFSREATNKLREFAPQNISNMLWAYATLGHSPGKLLLASNFTAAVSKTPTVIRRLTEAHCMLALQAKTHAADTVYDLT